MEPTDLRTLWMERNRDVDLALARTEPMLRDLAARRARSALRPALPVRAAEFGLALAAAAAIAPVAFAHRDEARYALAALPTLLWLLGFAWFALQQLLAGVRLDASAPVATLQQALLALRRTEFAALRWAVLGGVFAWLPLTALLVEASTGGALLARLPTAWLWANLALGAGVWLASPFLGRRLERAAEAGGAARRLADALTSRGVRRAEEQLRELAQFAHDAPA